MRHPLRKTLTAPLTASLDAGKVAAAILFVTVGGAALVLPSVGATARMAPDVSISPASHDYGTITTGSSSAPFTFTVANNGTSPSGTLAFVLSGQGSQFPLSNDTCTGTSLAANASCTVDASFAPTSPGPKTATLTVAGSGGSSTPSSSLTGTGASPTAVVLSFFSAKRQHAAVKLVWLAALDAGTLGFNAYREHKGKLQKLNRSLIPSLLGGSARGHAYSWLDRGAPKSAAKYRLQAVSLSGTRSWIGSAAVAH